MFQVVKNLASMPFFKLFILAANFVIKCEKETFLTYYICFECVVRESILYRVGNSALYFLC
jgi:hypothetical protein